MIHPTNSLVSSFVLDPEHAKSLAWHANERIEDGKLRHPANYPAWKKVD